MRDELEILRQGRLNTLKDQVERPVDPAAHASGTAARASEATVRPNGAPARTSNGATAQTPNGTTARKRSARTARLPEPSAPPRPSRPTRRRRVAPAETEYGPGVETQRGRVRPTPEPS